MTKKDNTQAVTAAEQTVESLEDDLQEAKEALETAEDSDVGDAVAESAERRIEAAKSDEERENIRSAEEVRLNTEAGEGPPDPNK